jgi:hypothetical protein
VDSTLLAALLPLLVAGLLLVGWALVDLGRSEVRWLPKWAWALIIVGSIPMGAIVYLVVGRIGPTTGPAVDDRDR